MVGRRERNEKRDFTGMRGLKGGDYHVRVWLLLREQGGYPCGDWSDSGRKLAGGRSPTRSAVLYRYIEYRRGFMEW